MTHMWLYIYMKGSLGVPRPHWDYPIEDASEHTLSIFFYHTLFISSLSDSGFSSVIVLLRIIISLLLHSWSLYYFWICRFSFSLLFCLFSSLLVVYRISIVLCMVLFSFAELAKKLWVTLWDQESRSCFISLMTGVSF